MEEKYTFSSMMSKSNLRMMILQMFGGAVVLVVGAIMFYGSYLFYVMLFAMANGLFIISIIIKSQKSEIVIDSSCITFRKRVFKYTDYETIIAREYKDQIIYILGQRENKKQKEIIVKLGGLALDSNEFLMRLNSFTHVEIEKV